MPTLSGPQTSSTLKGNAGKVFTINRSSEYDVCIESDSVTCCITDICVLDNGQVLVADSGNNVVKLLDHEYQVTSCCNLSADILSTSLITPSELAVTVDDCSKHEFEVQFIKVNNGQLLPGRKFRLKHEGRCITSHNRDLYISSGTAIYQYTLTGKKVRQIYEDTSASCTVHTCAVSPTGKILYITNYWQDKLLTLSTRDGSILEMFTDPYLRGPGNIYVTHAGHVLVCGYTSDTIIQLDSEGKNKLATLASRNDGVRDPASVCYNRHTASIIVGTYANMLLVLDPQSYRVGSPNTISEFPEETLRTLQLESSTREQLSNRVGSPNTSSEFPEETLRTLQLESSTTEKLSNHVGSPNTISEFPEETLQTLQMESSTSETLSNRVGSPNTISEVPEETLRTLQLESSTREPLSNHVGSPNTISEFPEEKLQTLQMESSTSETLSNPVGSPNTISEFPDEKLQTLQLESSTSETLSNRVGSPNTISEFPDEKLQTLQLESSTSKTLEDNTLHSDSISESSALGELRKLFEILRIDTMVECGTDIFPAFRHGCGALQGIITRGKSMFAKTLLNETEYQMVYPGCIQLYTTAVLLKVIKTSHPEKLTHAKEFSVNAQPISFPVLVTVGNENRTNIERWISNLNDNAIGVCVILVCKEQDSTYVAPRFCVFQSMTTISDIIIAADDLLERAVFSILGNLVETCVNKYSPPTHLTDNEKEKTLQSIFTYARTAYQRSEVPENERTSIPPEKTYNYPETIDAIINRLLAIEGVIGCSKTIGQLEIIIDNTSDIDGTSRKVNELFKHEDVKYILIYGKFKPFIAPGDEVMAANTTRVATLGGFARSLSNTEATACASISLPVKLTENLVALISRHAAIVFGERNCVRVGNVDIGQINNIHNNNLVDIVPVNVYKHCKEHCETRFKTETGRLMHGQLREHKYYEQRRGGPVHIWGSKTAPGLGTLGEIGFKTAQGFLIKIHDRVDGKSFCREGDSGAMVCTTDSRERTLYAVAMVLGIIEPSVHQPSDTVTYYAVLLNEAFEELGKYYRVQFKLNE